MFEPHGERALWQEIYDLLVIMEPGDLLTYEEMSEVTDRDIRRNRSALYSAQKHLELDGHRTLVCVPGKGYRVAYAGEHEHLATGHQRRARRQVVKARRRVTSANRGELSQIQRERMDVMESTLTRHEQLLRRNAARIDAVDQARKQTDQRTKADIAALSARLDRLARKLGEETH